MHKPLEQFICDTCNGVIENLEQGWIEWIAEYDDKKIKFRIHSFRIVHHMTSSPHGKERNGCYQHTHRGGHSSHLNQFLDPNNKMSNILGFLDIGPYIQQEYHGPEIADMRQFVETVRRLTIPYYEEARLYFEEASQDGYFESLNSGWIYATDQLKALIERYSKP